LPAFDYDNWTPGNYALDGGFPVKSLRPAINYVQMNGLVPEEGVGLKMNVWPDRQMSHPYDQMACSNDDGTGLLDIGDTNLYDDGDCQKSEDQVWCMNDGNSWQQWSNANGWAIDGPGNHNPLVPMGSVLFGLDDSIPCQSTRGDYCYNWGVDLDNTCLSAKFYYYNYDSGDYEYDENFFPVDSDPSCYPDCLDDALLGQAFIPMRDLCDNDSVCLNTSDGEFDGDEAGTCQDGSFIVDMDWNPYYSDSEQMWWTNYIVEISDCPWAPWLQSSGDGEEQQDYEDGESEDQTYQTYSDDQSDE
jgi:hypothetical protein